MSSSSLEVAWIHQCQDAAPRLTPPQRFRIAAKAVLTEHRFQLCSLQHRIKYRTLLVRVAPSLLDTCAMVVTPAEAVQTLEVNLNSTIGAVLLGA